MNLPQKESNHLKLSLGIVILLFIGVSVFGAFVYNSSLDTQLQLENEKNIVLADLSNLTELYEEAIADNSIQNTQLIAAKEQIETLYNELKSANNKVETLLKFKAKYYALEAQVEVLLSENEALKNTNTLLEVVLDSIEGALDNQKITNGNLSKQNSLLSAKIDTAKELQIVAINGSAWIQRSSGKLLPTKRARRADAIKVCFTVGKNNLADFGQKSYYVQIIDAKNNILGTNTPIKFGADVLKYSFVSTFDYKNENLEVCEFFTNNNGKFNKGVFTINIFNGATIVANTTFSLK